MCYFKEPRCKSIRREKSEREPSTDVALLLKILDSGPGSESRQEPGLKEQEQEEEKTDKQILPSVRSSLAGRQAGGWKEPLCQLVAGWPLVRPGHPDHTSFSSIFLL